jgi:hypothetical protein
LQTLAPAAAGEPLSLIGPDVTRPPIFRILDLGQNPVSFQRVHRAHRYQAMLQIIEGADNDIEVADACLILVEILLMILATVPWHNLNFKATFLFGRFF